MWGTVTAGIKKQKLFFFKLLCNPSGLSYYPQVGIHWHREWENHIILNCCSCVASYSMCLPSGSQIIEWNIHCIIISVERGQWDDVQVLYFETVVCDLAQTCILLSLPICLVYYILHVYVLLSASEQCHLLCCLEYKAATQHCRGSTKIWRKRSTEM